MLNVMGVRDRGEFERGLGPYMYSAKLFDFYIDILERKFAFPY